MLESYSQRSRGHSSGIKVVGSLIVPKDMTLRNHSAVTIMYEDPANRYTQR